MQELKAQFPGEYINIKKYYEIGLFAK